MKEEVLLAATHPKATVGGRSLSAFLIYADWIAPYGAVLISTITIIVLPFQFYPGVTASILCCTYR